MVENSLRVFNVPGNGLCFISCLRWFMCEAFNINLCVQEYSNRILTMMLFEWSDLAIPFMISDATDENAVKRQLREYHHRYFVLREYNTDFVDVIISRIAAWFDIRVVMLNLNSIEQNRADVERGFKTFYAFYSSNSNALIGNPYTTYNGVHMVVLRSPGDNAHYQLVMRNDYERRYHIDFLTCDLVTISSQIQITNQEDVDSRTTRSGKRYSTATQRTDDIGYFFDEHVVEYENEMNEQDNDSDADDSILQSSLMSMFHYSRILAYY